MDGAAGVFFFARTACCTHINVGNLYRDLFFILFLAVFLEHLQKVRVLQNCEEACVKSVFRFSATWTLADSPTIFPAF